MGEVRSINNVHQNGRQLNPEKILSLVPEDLQHTLASRFAHRRAIAVESTAGLSLLDTLIMRDLKLAEIEPPEPQLGDETEMHLTELGRRIMQLCYEDSYGPPMYR